MVKKSFLYRVYSTNRLLFYSMIIFLGGTIITNLVGWQVTPFFIWGMYSKNEIPQKNYDVFRLTANGTNNIDYTAGYSNANRFFLASPLELFISMQKNDNVDPTITFLRKKLKQRFSLIESVSKIIFNGKKEQQLFASWYKRYLEQTLKMPIKTLTVENLKVRFTESESLVVDSTQLINLW